MSNNTPKNIPVAGALSSLSESAVSRLVWGISAFVVVAVAFMMLFPQALVLGNFDVSVLPAFHALINGTCFVLLLGGLWAIRRRDFALHQKFMLSTFALSGLFLVSYIVYHTHAPATKFGGEGSVRAIYFFFLITHIILAAAIMPLALFTIVRSARGQFAQHRKVAKWTLPIWLYVTATGVIVYLMIRPYYAP